MFPSKPEQSEKTAPKQARPKPDVKPDRRAAALRDNLKRRKAQARARRERGSGSPEG
ncbi:MAG TPA: hypothetical protein VFP94_03550 [Terriglobales bacterium]|jgi:hypothetical protein|nr:hypothetical protein [Terriglobales bacterium]